MRAAILFLLLCRYLPAQQTGVEGVVTDSVTHQPMARVHIMLRATASMDDPQSDTYGAISKRDGHFSVAGMPPAVYLVTAQRNAYVYVPGKAPSTTVKPGEIAVLKIEMTPQAVISGRVVDENGDPVPHVNVSVVPVVSGSPESRARARNNARTDERGEFRIAGAPGKFYVSAMPEGGPGLNDAPAGAIYGTTWFPGTASKEQATALTVAPGREAVGIDIRLVQTRAMKISGIVTGAPQNPAATMVWLSAGHGRGEGFISSNSAVPAGPDGKFTIGGLAPGPYRLVARSEEMSDKPVLQSAFVDVALETGDATNIALALTPGEALEGVLEIDGAPAGKLTVRLAGQSQGPFGDLKGGDVGTDGTFRFEGVFADKYRVTVLPLPENAYIESVNADGVETTDGTLDLSHGVNGAKVKVTLSRNGGQVEGMVLYADGQPVATTAFVVLAATADEIDGEHFKRVEPGSKFSFQGLRPGKYRLMTLSPAQVGDDEPDAGTAQAMFAKAPEIEVHTGDRIVRDVTQSAEDPNAKP